MSRGVPEQDWKIFRKLRDEALARLSQRVLDDLGRMCADRSGSAYERYLEVHRFLRERDREMANAFDHLSRSRMVEHLAAMIALGLVEPHDLTAMSSETRERVQVLTDLQSG